MRNADRLRLLRLIDAMIDAVNDAMPCLEFGATLAFESEVNDLVLKLGLGQGPEGRDMPLVREDLIWNKQARNHRDAGTDAPDATRVILYDPSSGVLSTILIDPIAARGVARPLMQLAPGEYADYCRAHNIDPTELPPELSTLGHELRQQFLTVLKGWRRVVELADDARLQAGVKTAYSISEIARDSSLSRETIRRYWLDWNNRKGRPPGDKSPIKISTVFAMFKKQADKQTCGTKRKERLEEYVRRHLGKPDGFATPLRAIARAR